MNQSVTPNVPVVLVTGFGPFGSVIKNPSWEVAQTLKEYLEWKEPVHIIIEEIPVTYSDVSARIPDYWLKYNPTLVIHIGVSVGTKSVQIERFACNNDYCQTDVNDKTPEGGRCITKNAPQVLETLLPVEKICSRVHCRSILPVTPSNDAGRYLCEFIYYQSLFIDPKRTVFIHIPEVHGNFTQENVAETIQLIIYDLLHCVQPLPSLSPDESSSFNHEAELLNLPSAQLVLNLP